MNIQILINFFKKYRAVILYFTLLVGFFLLSSESLFANEPVLSEEDTAKVVDILNKFIMGAAALMGMVTSFITMFLYPGWTNGTLFGLQEYLKIIWVLISNIVYFIFAFILIAVAFMNIIGKGEGTWELKQAMPKFIVGVLIVPFSWFLVQFILSVSAILTVGVLTLPYDSFGGTASFEEALNNQDFAGKEICKDVIISFDGDFEPYQVENISETEDDLSENIQCRMDGENGDGKVTISELITGRNQDGSPSDATGLQNSIFGVISIYSYGILSIDKLDTITGTDLESIETIADLVFKIVFDILFIAVYLLLMIALLLALFVRGVRLWIYMMLSPTFGLLYFFGKGSEGVGSDNTKFSIKEFINLALVPVYVSAALAFGLIFILVASNGITADNEDENTLEAGGFTLTIIGAHGEGESEASVIAKLIVQMFGIVILWIAVMAALKSSTTTGNIVEPIAAFGKSVGDLAAKAPTYAPIIPTGGGPGSGMSVTGLSAMGSRIEQGIRGEAQTRGSDFANRIMPGDGASGSPSAGIRDIFTRSGISETSGTNQRLEVVRDALDAHGADLSRDRRAREELERRMQGIGVDVELSDVTNFQNIGRQLFQGMQAAGLPTASQGWNNERDVVQYLEGLQNTTTPNNGGGTAPAGGAPNQTGTVNINLGANTNQSFNTIQEAGEHFANETDASGGNRFTDRNALNTFLTSLQDNGGLNQTQINEILDAFDEERT